MRFILKSMVLMLMSVLLTGTALAEAGKTALTWYGHSAFKVVTPQGHVLFIDPWILNPLNKDGQADLNAITKADLILITHGHSDHVGQAADIARKTKARLVTTLDLGRALVAYGGFPKEQMGLDSLGNFGGVVSFFDGEVKIAFVPAIHSSGLDPKALGTSASENPQYAGNPGGFVVIIKDGPTIYHTGDTDLYSDMALVQQFGHINVMLACIGGHFTMGPLRAAQAVMLVNPDHVIPMHYGTFPTVLTGTVKEFDAALKPLGLGRKRMKMQVDETLQF